MTIKVLPPFVKLLRDRKQKPMIYHLFKIGLLELIRSSIKHLNYYYFNLQVNLFVTLELIINLWLLLESTAHKVSQGPGLWKFSQFLGYEIWLQFWGIFGLTQKFFEIVWGYFVVGDSFNIKNLYPLCFGVSLKHAGE